MKTNNTKTTCVGTGLIALDIILNGNPNTPAKYQAGGSCGNVLSILSFLGWESYPIARFSNKKNSDRVIYDLKRWGVKTKLIKKSIDGSTPIIIHRIKKDKKGKPIHRFEFKLPETDEWLPRYKPLLSKKAINLKDKLPSSRVFYFDRINRASIELAKFYKEKDAIIFFEPSSIGNQKLFEECLEISDIIKFSNERIKSYSQLLTKHQPYLEIRTKGTKGLEFRWKSRKAWKKLKPYKINKLVDSAGAGDWCSAGIINQLCNDTRQNFLSKKDKEIERALDAGQTLGAINCFFDGARGIMYNLTIEQLELAIKNFNKTTMNDLSELKIKKKKYSTDINISEILT